MKIAKAHIKHFRSIDEITLDLLNLTALCGGNSCGKSNVLRAIEFAFKPTEFLQETGAIFQNLISSKRSGQGGPRLSIYVNLQFVAVPDSLRQYFGIRRSENFVYSFRAYRSGAVTRSINRQAIDEDQFLELKKQFSPFYIPTIRDLRTDGLLPFQQLYLEALRRSRGDASIKAQEEKVRAILQQRGEQLLRSSRRSNQSIVPHGKLMIDASGVSIESSYKSVRLTLQSSNGEAFFIDDIGTGHQSLIMLEFFRQLGESMPGHSIFLYEEPDNHLHPTIIRALADDLIELSGTSQVLISTHSATLVSQLGIDKVRPLFLGDRGQTEQKSLQLSRLESKELNNLRVRFASRLVEPLFAKRVVIVEGAADANFLSALYELRKGRRPDHDDIIIFNANGKDDAVKIAQYVDGIGCDWRCLFDWDVVLAEESPTLVLGLIPEQEKDELKRVVERLRDKFVNSSTGRGKTARSVLARMSTELAGAPSRQAVFEGSKAERLINNLGLLNQKERQAIRGGLGARVKKRYVPLMRKAKIWVWADGALENVLLSNANRVDMVETMLINHRFIKRPIGGAGRLAEIESLLHKHAPNIEFMVTLVNAFESNGLFSRTEVNQAFDFLFS